MAKLVDAPDLGSGAVMCKGSSPFSPILLKTVSAVFFAPVGISPFARYCIRSRSHGSIILRRLSIVAGRFHQSALHSGLRFLLAHSLKDRILRSFYRYCLGSWPVTAAYNSIYFFAVLELTLVRSTSSI